MTAHHDSPSGRALAAQRKARGWTQRQLAKAAGLDRSAVQYWEAADRLDQRGWAVCRMAKALGWTLARFSSAEAREGGVLKLHDTPAQGDGLLSRRDTRAGNGMRHNVVFAAVPAEPYARGARADRPLAIRRHTICICGAKTRKGTPCRNKIEPGKRRCKFHGGKSTGARTPEGIERIREAQRRRWAKTRQEP